MKSKALPPPPEPEKEFCCCWVIAAGGCIDMAGRPPESISAKGSLGSPPIPEFGIDPELSMKPKPEDGVAAGAKGSPLEAKGSPKGIDDGWIGWAPIPEKGSKAPPEEEGAALLAKGS